MCLHPVQTIGCKTKSFDLLVKQRVGIWAFDFFFLLQLSSLSVNYVHSNSAKRRIENEMKILFRRFSWFANILYSASSTLLASTKWNIKNVFFSPSDGRAMFSWTLRLFYASGAAAVRRGRRRRWGIGIGTGIVCLLCCVGLERVNLNLGTYWEPGSVRLRQTLSSVKPILYPSYPPQQTELGFASPPSTVNS